VTGRARALWDLPRVGAATGPTRRDWVLVSLLVAAAAGEGIWRADVAWRGVAVVLALTVVLVLPWRRVQPGRCVAIGFGSIALVQVLSITVGTGSVVGLTSSACVLLVAYAAARWGSGRELVLLVMLLAIAFGLGYRRDYTTVGDAIAEAVILSFPVVVGLAVRAQTTARTRQLEAVRVLEREQLARELHDTVAHHVSAMVVRAQAGRVVAAGRPEAAVEALLVIEEEGSRTLAEMRALVGALRDDDGPALAPAASLRDIAGLADQGPGAARVRVTVTGDVDDVHPSVAAALYRIAQESVTNATRHAAGASTVDVDVRADRDDVRLLVRDDGEPALQHGSGYGLVGMSERAVRLGGSLRAGPAPGGSGWVVDAVLPKSGVAR
jgi:signal transduction histidine kinase